MPFCPLSFQVTKEASDAKMKTDRKSCGAQSSPQFLQAILSSSLTKICHHENPIRALLHIRVLHLRAKHLSGPSATPCPRIPPISETSTSGPRSRAVLGFHRSSALLPPGALGAFSTVILYTNERTPLPAAAINSPKSPATHPPSFQKNQTASMFKKRRTTRGRQAIPKWGVSV